ncbi:histidine phosphatase family protein [Candidatus Binatia bacterium]|nr:histidine phosphatase family protein [Candidatus Binatia bacterium]
MNGALQQVYLARHGDTAWTATGQHTGRTDIGLTATGEEEARRLGARLRGRAFALVLTSPLQRAQRTCELAGFGAHAVPDPDLMEWNYGDYEGRRSVDIHAERPEWNLFRDGCPNGETAAEVGARADRIVAKVRRAGGDAALFAHGHFLRVLVTRWLGLPPDYGRYFLLNAAALSVLGYEHNRDEPAVRLWNEAGPPAGNL